MVDSNKTGNTPKTSTQTVGKTPAKEAEAAAAPAAKPKDLLNELHSRLDNLFALDGPDVKPSEKRQKISSPFDDLKEPPLTQKPKVLEKDKAVKIKAHEPTPPAAVQKKATVAPALPTIKPVAADSQASIVQKKKVEIKAVGKIVPDPLKQKALKLDSFKPIHPNEIAKAKKKTDIPEPAQAEAAGKPKTKDDLPGKVQKKEQRPTKAAVQEKPADKPSALIAQKEKPIISKAKADLVKAPRSKGAEIPIPAKPPESEKATKKTTPKRDKKKGGRLKWALGGIVLLGGLMALPMFFQTPAPLNQSQPITAPIAYKIQPPPTKAPETTPALPTAAPVPESSEAVLIKPEAPSAAVSADSEKPPAPAQPETNAGDEIKAFLQEWKTAWEKSAGAKGDTDALMRFYSEDFTSNGLDKKKWRQDKAEKNRIKKWIRIQLDKIHITGPFKDSRYAVRFNQVYQSSNYSDTSEQVLILKKESSGWKIIGINPQTTTAYPYSIHDGSYRTLAAAREAVDTYRSMGLEAYWTIADLGEKGIWYRVLIGFFTDQESAKKLIEAKALKNVKPEETRYANLIGTYRSEKDLEHPRRWVMESGFSPYAIIDDSGGIQLYVGAYNTLKKAENFSAELKAKKIPSQVVER